MSRKKIFLFWLAMIFLSLILVETSLFFVSHIIKSQSILDENDFLSENSELRIIALGESTTAGDHNWPFFLEKKLQAKGYSVKVYNLAEAGTNLFFQNQKLKKYYPKIKPHFVIGMLGVNKANMEFLRPYDSKIDSLFNSLRIVRVSRLIIFILSSYINDPNFSFKNLSYSGGIDLRYKPPDFSIDESRRQTLRSQMDSEIQQIYKIVKNGQMSGLKNLINNQRQYLKIEDQMLYTLIVLGEIYPLLFISNIDETEVEHYFTLLEDYMNESNHMVVDHYLHLSTALKKYDRCFNLGKKLLLIKYKFKDQDLIQLASCAKNDMKNKKDWSELFTRLGYLVHQIENDDQLYHQIVDYSISSGSCFVAVQYPLMNIDELKMRFDAQNSPSLFIENRKNFEIALQSYDKFEIFTDLFAGEFGHTTLLGSEILAENILNSILQHFELSPEQSFYSRCKN